MKNGKEKNDKSINDWIIKYYKGLGTSDVYEAQEYFKDLERHQKSFCKIRKGERELIDLAFNKKRAGERKEWLQQYQLGTHIDHNVSEITFEEFINKELISFSIADNLRSIPCLVDGLKPGQRKILFSVFKRNLKQSIRVSQLSGYVSEHSLYHHGEASLHSAIINLAQDFVGSNNLNLLYPDGQFGSRHMGGKDAAAARYINVSPHRLLRNVFNPIDDNLLTYLNDEGQDIEPRWYIPILPMVLVNGCEGIGTGWSSFIPNFNPRDIIDNIRRLMIGEEMVPMHPWYRGFQGNLEQIANHKYRVNGVIRKINATTVEISELPIRVWTQAYKDQLISWTARTQNSGAWVKDFREYHTTTAVRFIVTLTPDVMAEAEKEGLQKKFKITTILSTSNMVCFDVEGHLHRYESALDILREWYTSRLFYYHKRKEFLHDELQKQWNKANNKLRFVEMFIEQKIDIRNKPPELIVSMLQQMGFDPIVEKRTKTEQAADEDNKNELSSQRHYGYDYLLTMPIRSFTKERIITLRNECDQRQTELENLQKLTPEDLWNKDLDYFLIEWDKILAQPEYCSNEVQVISSEVSQDIQASLEKSKKSNQKKEQDIASDSLTKSKAKRVFSEDSYIANLSSRQIKKMRI